MNASRFHRASLAAAMSVLVIAAVGLPAPASSAPAAAMIRGGHFSPDTPGVDVYLTAFRGGTTTLWLSGVGYGDVSSYQRLTPGLYAVSMRPHGAAPSTPAALRWTLHARPGDAYTACAVGMHSNLRGIVLHDDLGMAPRGRARVRVIQAASAAPRADIGVTGGPVLARNVAFATSTGYSNVMSGRYQVTATAVGTPAVTTTARIDLPADTVHTLVVLDAKGGGITLRSFDDATGATMPPAGPVPAGAGGTSGPRSSTPSWTGEVLAAVLVLMVVAAGAAARTRDRRSAGRR